MQSVVFTDIFRVILVKIYTLFQGTIIENCKEARLNQCGFCFKIFRNSWKLKRHLVVHTKEKAYACKLCSRRYNQPGNLKRHMKNRHLPKSSPKLLDLKF